MRPDLANVIADLAPFLHFQALLERARQCACEHGPLRTAVVHAVDAESLLGAVLAAEAGLIAPVFIGPKARLEKAAAACQLDLAALDSVARAPSGMAAFEFVEHSHAAAERAVALARAQQVHAVMKGSLHTDELMHAVVNAEQGLRTSRRMSHIFVIDTPHYPRTLLLTDAAINVHPDLLTKADIAQNAIDLAHALGLARPRMALLSAVETITPKLPSTLDAAALCKMADRGQITGALLDGPLAFDNAVSLQAAASKGIVSPVAGQADILLVPNLEAGNMLAKQLDYLGGAAMAGVVLGARVPIVLTSRADKATARLLSCAVAVLWVVYAAKQAARKIQT